MKTPITIKILSIFFILCSISFSQTEIKWYVQEIQINNNLHSVFFLDSLNGWICGNQVLLKTTDGGNNWHTVATTIDWRNVLFISDSIGFVGGGSKIAKSYDGGLTWYQKYSTSQWIHDFYFLDSSVGFAVGGYNKLLKTTDAGETWNQTLLPGIAQIYYDIFFLNDSVGWACGAEDVGGPVQELIVKTTDYGESWTILSRFNNNTTLFGVHFFDNDTGICISTRKFFKTTNGGQEWIVQSSNPAVIYDMSFINDSNIWSAGSRGGIHNTQDLGITWASTFTDTNKWINSIFFVSEDLGWAVGGNGFIATTQDIVVSTSYDAFIQKYFYLSQNYPNPFNPVTTISYQIPERGFVTLKVYDVLGNEVATLVNEEKPAGSYEFKWNASNLPSGIYFYRMRAGNFVETKKMILMK